MLGVKIMLTGIVFLAISFVAFSRMPEDVNETPQQTKVNIGFGAIISSLMMIIGALMAIWSWE